MPVSLISSRVRSHDCNLRSIRIAGAVRDDFHAPKINKAREKLALLKMNPKELKQYESYLMALATERDVMETAREEGHEQGLEQTREIYVNQLRDFLMGKYGDLPERAEAKLVHAEMRLLFTWTTKSVGAGTLRFRKRR